MKQHAANSGFFSVLPFVFFIVIFFGMAIAARDFYAVPVLVVFSLTAAFSLVLFHKNGGLEKNVSLFCRAAGDYNIILMVLIFLLAGCFGNLASDIGCIGAVVNFCLSYLPASAVTVGLFVVCCFVSLAMGSSMGTVISMAPIAVGLANQTSSPVALFIGAVLGGAMFGDNLSAISDTTIAAVRTQGCDAGDKFKQNFLLVLPAAFIVLIIYTCLPVATKAGEGAQPYDLVKIIPYVVVLGGALLRINVLGLLALGSGVCAFIGLWYGHFDTLGLLRSMHKGMVDMEDLSLLSIVAAGTSGLVKAHGGLDYILHKVVNFVDSRKGAEGAIALLVGAVNLCTANNTIAIVIAGPLAKDIAAKFDISPARSASLLDLFASVVQGLIPYGAQVLCAVGFAKISPLAVVPYNFYCYLSLLAGLVAIKFSLSGQGALAKVEKARSLKVSPASPTEA